MREGHGARSRLAARRTSWWAGRHHHCPCCGSSGLGEPLPLALTGAVYDPVDELLLGRQDHRTLECQAKRKFQDANAGPQKRSPATQPRQDSLTRSCGRLR